MKLSFLLLVLLTFYACDEQKKIVPNAETATKDQAMKLNGTWEMVGYYNYVDNKIADSFQTNNGFRQVKMYTDHKVMWSKNVPQDSTEWFGYGDYNHNNNELNETLEYGSEMMKKIIEERKEFTYELHLEKDKFSQIEVDDLGNRIYSENYKRIE
ncbi:hypothetical protein ES711_01160 [Gelidibacter salicanalis]|uniref:Lipocalin-like domain-containing protein n=1 Tax=Gelidibacter salicanalis TaxID=291193 RepID=A0A5C7AR97_9FLAO|nr:hypothetical protein [Gelidibacter salicanalis]TXE10544.1 hypothetical protein ES711_01160 [Gelidibacter salicanalis]